MKCLDSDILIAILRGDPEAKEMVELLDKEVNLVTTTINAYEILFGARKSFHLSKNVLEARNLLGKLEVLNLTLESADLAGEIHKHLLDKGQLIDLRDIFIASIAISNNCTLVTRNLKDFSRISSLRLEKW